MDSEAVLDEELGRLSPKLRQVVVLCHLQSRTYAEAVEHGWGKEDFSAVTHVIERRIGRKVSR